MSLTDIEIDQYSKRLEKLPCVWDVLIYVLLLFQIKFNPSNVILACLERNFVYQMTEKRTNTGCIVRADKFR